MSNNHSVIEHRANYHYIKLEKDYLAICSTGKQSPHCKALILSILEQWTNTKRTKGESDYIYLTLPQWVKYTYLLYARNTVINCLAELREEGLIPTCVLRCNSEMGKIGHRTKKLGIVFKLSQLLTQRLNHGVKGGKSMVRKSLFP